jgi:oligosaccharyltransferase complex subunit delta (ribophorin II)
MQWWQTVLQLSVLASAALPAAAASWGFVDATVSVQTKGAGVGSGLKHEYAAPVLSFLCLHFPILQY